MARPGKTYRRDTRAGDLRHRVAFFYRKVSVTSGITKETWEPLCECWASVEPISGKEYFQAVAVNREDSVRFTVRYRPGITAGMIIRFRGTEYNIESIINTDMGNVWLEILARSVLPKDVESANDNAKR